MHVCQRHQQAGKLLPARDDAESAACLIELVVSSPALASPMIFAFELCACSRKDEKSDELRGCGPNPAPCRHWR